MKWLGVLFFLTIIAVLGFVLYLNFRKTENKTPPVPTSVFTPRSSQIAYYYSENEIVWVDGIFMYKGAKDGGEKFPFAIRGIVKIVSPNVFAVTADKTQIGIVTVAVGKDAAGEREIRNKDGAVLARSKTFAEEIKDGDLVEFYGIKTLGKNSFQGFAPRIIEIRT